ncbi:nucleolar protein 9 [Rhypophila sp. PSN 637]
MGKARKSKRQLIRDEKRAKKRARDVGDEEEEQDTKRQRHDDIELNGETTEQGDIPMGDGNALPAAPGSGFEREFFGMLADDEQEYFRRADELLELNDFPTTEERDIFLQNVYTEAKGKELKLASSQSCSRLMERLILLSNTRQKKQLFGAFAGHFISMVTHRFASHCCEKLFLLSALVVAQEVLGEVEQDVGMDTEADGAEADSATKYPMEDLFLATLDELEEHLSFLLSDRFGSHALRVLLVVLSGRPLDKVSTKSLLQSKKKEHITVEGAAAYSSELQSQVRAVPESFGMAINKILTDSTANLDPTALRVLAKHPTGNPALQLLLELELEQSSKAKIEKPKGKLSKEEKEAEAAEQDASMLGRLVPGAPASFSDETSPACEFVNSMLYDPIGSRLLETLIAHCPGKIFKGLQGNIFGPRIQSLLRNDIACYPAIQVLNRLSKEDLDDAVQKSVTEMPTFVNKGRFNVIKALFERCNVRKATDSITALLKALTSACGGDWKQIIPKLCALDEPPKEDDENDAKKFQSEAANAKHKSALLSHGCQVVTTLLAIPGPPAKAIQQSLVSLKADKLLYLATSTSPTSNILVQALSTPAQLPNFHKILVSSLRLHVFELATSHFGNNVLNGIIKAPSKGEGIAVPFHLKETIMAQLEEHETDLRGSWLGRNVWRTWKGDLWSNRRHDWVRWAKETDKEDVRLSKAPKPKENDAGSKPTTKKMGETV